MAYRDEKIDKTDRIDCIHVYNVLEDVTITMRPAPPHPAPPCSALSILRR